MGNGHATDTRSMVSLPNGTVQTGKPHTVNSSIVVGVYHWTAVERKELLPDSSLSHLEHGSRRYDLELCGTSMSYLLHHHEAVLRGMGTFLKA